MAVLYVTKDYKHTSDVHKGKYWVDAQKGFSSKALAVAWHEHNWNSEAEYHATPPFYKQIGNLWYILRKYDY